MIGGYNHQRVRVGQGELAANADGSVELDGVENPAFGVHQVGLLVNRGALDHDHEAVRVFVQDLKRFDRHFIKHGLVGEAVVVHHGGGAPALVDLVLSYVHVRVAEKAQ